MDAHAIRMRIKSLIEEARDEYPNYDFVYADVDETDVVIEALIHLDKFEIQVKART
jgi:hypothetical protein